MSKQTDSEREPEYWKECGFPQSIADFLANLAGTDHAKPHRVLLRARHFREYWKDPLHSDEDIGKAWRQLQSAARTTDSALNFFLSLPDRAERDLYPKPLRVQGRGRASLSIKRQRAIYKNYADAIGSILTLTSFESFSDLLRDAKATGGDAWIECLKLRAVSAEFRKTLGLLGRLLKLVDPSAKYLTGKPDDADAARQAYTAAVAALHETYLKRPKLAALARLASINIYPESPISDAAVRQALKKIRRKTLAK